MMRRDGAKDGDAMNGMRVYVAGASSEPDRCRWAMDAVRSAGGVITCDWLAAIEAAGAANEGLSHEVRVSSALADLVGVETADYVWLLAPQNASAGAWVELGYALACEGVRVVVSGPGSGRCIFAAIADHEAETDEAALQWLRERL